MVKQLSQAQIHTHILEDISQLCRRYHLKGGGGGGGGGGRGGGCHGEYGWTK